MQGILYTARGTTIETALDDVQIMPPGRHAISPIGPDGEPVDLEVEVNAATAQAIEATRARYQSEADAGSGDAPYFDFNHDDGPAAAWVKSIYWGGDEPHTGGVRAKIAWSDAGREAIEGRLFRRFSPAFIVDPATGTITGAPVNMGGLVNRAAFRSISAFFSKDHSPNNSTTTQPTNTMTPEEITALQSENETLRKQIAELQAQLEDLAKKDAEAQVEAAAKDGRIAPAKEVKAKWVATILKDKSASELLAGMAPTPIFTSKAVTDPAKTTPQDRDTLRAKLAELPRHERPAFFAQHKEALLSK